MSGSGGTIAITGASGFVGGQLARHFHAKGYRVLAFGRRADARLPEGVCYERWDISHEHRNARRYEVAAVVHCAGSVSEWGSYEEMYRANVAGPRNVLAAFAEAALFVHISSASVYGTGGRKIMVREEETYPRRYLNHYSTTKMLGEVAVRESAHPNRVILRPHIIYGPGDTTLLPRILKARRAGRVVVLGDGRNLLSLTHVGNLAQAVELLMGRQMGLEAFNVCDGRADSLNEIMLTLCRTMDWGERLVHVDPAIARAASWMLERLYLALRLKSSPLLTPYVVEQMSHDFTMDTSKAREMLGYAPRHEYPEGFREVREWLVGEGDGA